jgi:hypothetical protein
VSVNSSGVTTIHTTGNEIDIAATDTLKILNTTDSSSLSTGSLTIAAGLSVAKNLYVGGGIYVPTVSGITDLGIAAKLNYYEEFNSGAIDIAGAYSLAAAANLYVLAIGRVVTITWVSTRTPTTDGSYITGTGTTLNDLFFFEAIPAQFRPQVPCYGLYRFEFNGTYGAGIAYLDTSGTLWFQYGLDSFPSGFTIRIFDGSFSYILY